MRLLVVLLCLVAGLAPAQDYPAKSVRLIAAAAPGGNPDVLARMLAARLSDTFGKPFIVENIPGAGGVVAAEQVARANPDGHVLMLGDSGALAINPARRSASLPDVPTAIEQGYDDFDIATVIGLQAPAGAPREVVARLQAAVAKILRERETAERMTNLGMELMENGTEHYARFVKEDLQRYAQAVKAAGVRQD